MQETRLRGTRR